MSNEINFKKRLRNYALFFVLGCLTCLMIGG